MKFCLAILALTLLSCSKDPLSTEATNNPNVPVSKLFEHEGCTVYRFGDAGFLHYYAVCKRGSVTTQTVYSSDDSTTVDEIPTVAK